MNFFMKYLFVVVTGGFLDGDKSITPSTAARRTQPLPTPTTLFFNQNNTHFLNKTNTPLPNPCPKMEVVDYRPFSFLISAFLTILFWMLSPLFSFQFRPLVQSFRRPERSLPKTHARRTTISGQMEQRSSSSPCPGVQRPRFLSSLSLYSRRGPCRFQVLICVYFPFLRIFFGQVRRILNFVF